MKKIKISSFGGKDSKKFKNIKNTREKVIKKTTYSKINNNYPLNNLSTKIHPSHQKLIIKNIIEETPDIKTIYFANANGETLSTFRAGQYITLLLNIDNQCLSRPYSLSSSPYDALKNIYRISVKRVKDGIVSNYLLDNLKINDGIDTLEPSGEFYLSEIRDKKHIVALVEDIGISPIISMARSIYEKSIDKELTIFYYCKNKDDFIYKKELIELCKNNKIKCVFISDIEDENIIKGPITINLIKSYVTSKFTIFIKGSQKFHDYLNEELKDLNLDIKDIRVENNPIYDEIIEEEVIEENENTEENNEEEKEEESEDTNDNSENEAENTEEIVEEEPIKEFNIKIFTHNDEFNIKCKENQTILDALEKSNIKARSKCRSGVCGYCKTLLLWGEIRVEENREYRKKVDIKYNYIHPCCSYPTSDITIKLDI